MENQTQEALIETDSEVTHILMSKTFWTNLLAPVFLWGMTKYGIKLDADTQTIVIFVIMSLANIGLRYATSKPVTMSFTALRRSK